MASKIVSHPKQPRTSYYHRLPLESTEEAPLLMFVPGNPGLVEYYTTYLDLIQEDFPTFEILCASHAGYLTTDGPHHKTKQYKFYNMNFQVKHKYEIVRDHILSKSEQGKKADLYFLSHSMGSHILQRVIDRLLKDPDLEGKFEVKLVGSICPVIIDIAHSESGVLFIKLFRFLPVIPILLFVTAILKLILSEKMAKNIIGRYFVARPKLQSARSVESWENSIDGCYNLYRDPLIIRHALNLAQEEMDSIVRDDEFNDWFFKELPLTGTKIWTFFALKDHWVHDTTRDYLHSRYHDPQQNVFFDVDELKEGITHSFCVDQSVEFAAITGRSLRKMFPELAKRGHHSDSPKPDKITAGLRNRAGNN